jgi:hypothetical protein
VVELFGTDILPAAIVLVLVLLGLMKGTSPVFLPTSPTGHCLAMPPLLL